MKRSLLQNLVSRGEELSFTRALFLRGLAVVYIVAFLSFRYQAAGLIGEHGILPLGEFFDHLSDAHGADASGIFPSVFWYDSSDHAIDTVCIAGAVCAGLVLLGMLQNIALSVAWALYLSIAVAGQDFMSFQWDYLLLEVGLVSILFAPCDLRPRWISRAPPSVIGRWLLIWVLFRLLFFSGFVKLASGDETWRSLTALSYHYFTQPLPTPASYYALELPKWFQTLSAAVMFFIELVVPFFFFLGTRLRCWAGILVIFFQCMIALTGNYGFFNLLTIVLTIPLFDDAQLVTGLGRLSRWLVPALPTSFHTSGFTTFRDAIYLVLGLGFVLLSVLAQAKPGDLPEELQTLKQVAAPLRSCNTYGLFANMTTERHELSIEGSRDGTTWSEYGFPYKPGDPMRRPPIAEPYMPRLDWQMWFVPLGRASRSPWLFHLLEALLQGFPPVIALFEKNPFPDAPPRFVRVVMYDYHFALPVRGNEARRKEAKEHPPKEKLGWWKRDYLGVFIPPVELKRSKRESRT